MEQKKRFEYRLDTVLKFGKYKDKTINEVIKLGDVGYIKWMYNKELENDGSQYPKKDFAQAVLDCIGVKREDVGVDVEVAPTQDKFPF